MLKNKVTIGIDPDVDKSGMAIFNYEDSQLHLYQYDLPDLFQQLLNQHFKSQKNDYRLLIRLESGHKVARTWQKRTVGTIKNVGRNLEIGSQIEKFLVKYNIPYELVNPFGGSSINHEKFCKITNWDKKKLTNPEKRVAGLLAYKR